MRQRTYRVMTKCRICGTDYEGKDKSHEVATAEALLKAQKCEKLGRPRYKYHSGMEIRNGAGKLIFVIGRRIIRKWNGRHEPFYEYVKPIGHHPHGWYSQSYTAQYILELKRDKTAV